jgi:hypothetical protein
MTDVFNEDVVGLWFVSMPKISPHGGDWLATIAKHGEDMYRLTYRFRYYAGTDDPFDGTDTKSWYGFEAKAEDLPDLIQRTQEIAAMTRAVFGGKSWELMRGEGTFEQFKEEFFKLPFVNVREASAN